MSRFLQSDVAGLFRLIAALYPHQAKAYADVGQDTIGAWHSMLYDIPAECVSAAVKQHAAVGKYPPSIAEIRENAIKLADPSLTIGADEAWGLVIDAMRKGISQKLLPAVVADVVKGMGGLYMIGRSENPDTVRAQFLKLYDQRINREIKQRQIPENIAEFKRIGGANGKDCPVLSMPG